jgi:hypothetical protein
MYCKRCGEEKDESYFEIKSKVATMCNRCKLDSSTAAYADNQIKKKNKEINELKQLIYDIAEACKSNNGRRLRRLINEADKEVLYRLIILEVS